MVDLGCYIRNLFIFPPSVRRIFSDLVMEKIERAIAEAESLQGCEIRFVVEGGLPLRYLRRKDPAKDRADDLFAQLRIWNTERNNGILFYLVLSEKAFHLVPDRGAGRVLNDEDWSALSLHLEKEFQTNSYESAVLNGISLLTELLRPHFPEPVQRGELSNAPLIC